LKGVDEIGAAIGVDEMIAAMPKPTASMMALRLGTTVMRMVSSW